MKVSIVSSTFKTAFGQFIGLGLGAVAVKILAVLAGPAGVGLYSILRHLQQTLSSIASIGGQNAVVQGLCSHSGDERQRFFLSSFYLFVFANLLVCVGVLFFADVIAAQVLGGEHVSAVRWLVIPVTLGTSLFFLRGILTAEQQFGALSLVNALNGLGAVLVALPVGLAYVRGYPNILLLLVGGGLFPAALMALVYVSRLGYFRQDAALAIGNLRRNAAWHFLRVAVPSLLSLFMTMGCVLIVRAYIVRLYGLEGAGHFDAAWSISAMYLTLFLVSLQSYLLPELSQIDESSALQSALNKVFRFSLISSLPLIVALVVLKPLVINILFSQAFMSSLDILRWALLGDFVRVLGWIISTTLLSRADMKGFVIGEGLWSVVFTLSAVLFLSSGIEWVGFAYLLAYMIYFAFLTWRLRTKHGVTLGVPAVLQWLIGFAIVIVSAWLSWRDTNSLNWSLLMIAPAVLFSLSIMRADERSYLWYLLTRHWR
ncbi:oligosaccharide flippase family protein [Azonexus sp.]|jgi:O-antigen/teichoic acid export membrane protein|uniref:oligosaccharide flippase family protein n=1 Tax=Azonexus sp. TaxID=1872668 RepID=UPI002835E186|nr:oligosaccharide flippase family protein [Azonexus sp.]MDR1995915.1 oligosaccharide flippase family protein [Azonexus sp.]